MFCSRASKERAAYEKKLAQYKATLAKEHASLKAAVDQVQTPSASCTNLLVSISPAGGHDF